MQAPCTNIQEYSKEVQSKQKTLDCQVQPGVVVEHVTSVHSLAAAMSTNTCIRITVQTLAQGTACTALQICYQKGYKATQPFTAGCCSDAVKSAAVASYD